MRLSIKWQILRNGKDECARDDARRRVSERNRRKAALSAEITQEGIHRRLKPNGESCVSAVCEPSSKQPSLDPPPAALRLFPCAIKILSFQNFYKVLKTCSTGRKDFFDTLTQVSLCKSKTPECKHIPEQLPQTQSSPPALRFHLLSSRLYCRLRSFTESCLAARGLYHR